MLSWVTGIQKHQIRKQPSLQQQEFAFDPPHLSFQDEKPNKPHKRGGLLPKLRRALESATNNHNGSFPAEESNDEAAFEACDSNSYCSMSVTDSCASNLSYNMSRVDEDDETEHGIRSPNSVSETDSSVFGHAFREMIRFGKVQEKKERDDVWLLSTDLGEHQNESEPVPEEPATPSSILRKVPVLVLSGLPDRQMRQNNIGRSQSSLTSWHDDVDDDEEEIDFGGDSSMESFSRETEFFKGGEYEDMVENNNKNSMQRFHRSRSRPQIFGNNIKDNWNNFENRKKGKGGASAKRKHRRRKRKVKSPSSAQEDPLKQLSRCHEQMSQSQRPFSPSKAFSLIRNRRQREENTTFDEKGYSLYSKASSMEDEPLGSLTCLSSQTNASEPGYTLGTNSLAYSEDQSDPDDEQGTLESSSDGCENELETSLRQAPKIKIGEPQARSAGKKKTRFKFRSPRRDTPRVFWGEEGREDDESGEEVEADPRILYTSEGDVAAIIHPRPPSRRRQEKAQPKKGVFHLFHSELSTLYEEASSLESSSFGASSIGANSNRRCPTSSLLLGESFSSSEGESQSKENAPDADQRSAHNCQETKAEEPVDLAHRTEKPPLIRHKEEALVDECEMKLRWEFSLGLVDTSGDDDDKQEWSKPLAGMTMMNEEELSSDYVAEI
jgi:hypothetical protein